MDINRNEKINRVKKTALSEESVIFVSILFALIIRVYYSCIVFILRAETGWGWSREKWTPLIRRMDEAHF